MSDQDKLTSEILNIAKTVHKLNPDERRAFYWAVQNPKECNLDQPEPEYDNREGIGILKPWKPYTLQDAYKPRPPIEYLANGIFMLPSLNIVFGSPGCLKSFLLADLAICAAGGKPWLEPLPKDRCKPIATKCVPVAWLDFDNGKRLTDERFDAIGKALKLPDSIPLYYYSLPDPWLNANNRDMIDDLAYTLKNLNIQAVIIDNLGAITGGADENSAQMVQVMSNLRFLAEYLQAAVIVIHHQRKNNKGEDDKSRSESMRGHSSINAALDVALQVDREYQSDRILVTATKSRRLPVKQFAAQFTYQKTSSGDMESARFFGMSIESDIETVIRVAEDVLSDREMNTRDIEAYLKNHHDTKPINRDTIREALIEARKQGRIATRDKAGAIIYCLPDKKSE